MPIFFPFERSVQAAETLAQHAASNNETEFAHRHSILARFDAPLGVKG